MATSNLTIKITALPNIGNAIAPTTLVPVVNMAGSPVTQKANLQLVGNLILAGAGTANFVPAALSTLSYSVVNAAQPNITSVGTLTGLTISNLSNLHLPGGTNGYFLQTNGNGNLTWAAGGGGGNGSPAGANSQIQFNNSGAFGANAGLSWTSSSGTLNTSNLSVTTNATVSGNIVATNITANANLTASDIFTGTLNGPENANFVVYSNGGTHNFTFGDDGTFYAPDKAVLSGNGIYIGPGANELPGLGNAVMIASSNSNTFVQGVINNVSDIGSADWVAQGHLGDDDGGWIDMGFTSTSFSDPIYDITGPGDGYIFVESFYEGQVPGGREGRLVIATGENGTNNDIVFGMGGFTQANLFARMSYANNAFELMKEDSLISFYDGSSLGEIAGVHSVGLRASSYAEVFITSANSVAGTLATPSAVTGQTAQWPYNVTSDNKGQWVGTGTAADGVTLYTQQVTANSINFWEDQAHTIAYNLPSPGLVGASGTFNSGSIARDINLIAGAAIDANTGIGANVVISTNNGVSNEWVFDPNGILNIPANGTIRNSNLVLGSVNIVSNNYAQLQWTTDVGSVDPGSTTEPVNWMYVDIDGAHIQSIGNGYQYNWDFSKFGTTTIPGNLVANGNLASPAPYLSGFSSLSAIDNIGIGSNFDIYANGLMQVSGTTAMVQSNTIVQMFTQDTVDANNQSYVGTYIGNVQIGVSSATAGRLWKFDVSGSTKFPVTDYGNLPSAASSAGTRAFINDANLVAAGNFGATVGSGGSNTVPVYSDGTNWCIG